MQGLQKAKDAIRSARTIAISGHVNPDGDSIGSLLALGLGLERMGKAVTMVSTDGVPQRYRMLPGAGRIAKSMRESVDPAITVDCSSKEIVGIVFDSLREAKEILEIDHHDFRRPFGTVSLIDARAAAVGEIIYKLLRQLKVRITPQINVASIAEQYGGGGHFDVAGCTIENSPVSIRLLLKRVEKLLR